MAATKGGTWDRILDAAEQVFAEKGYDGATTREIAALSGDTLGTLSYHFGTKESLVLEVLKRRFDEMNEQRRAKYRMFMANRNGGVPDLDEAITAIVEPVMRLASANDPAWRNYIIIIYRFMYVADEDQGRLIAKILDPIGVELLGWLKATCPEVAHVDLAYAYQFIIGCMLDSVVQAKNDRTKRISGGSATATNFEEVRSRLLPFLIGGTKAILQPSTS